MGKHSEIRSGGRGKTESEVSLVEMTYEAHRRLS